MVMTNDIISIVYLSILFISFIFIKIIPGYWYANILSILNLICELAGWDPIYQKNPVYIAGNLNNNSLVSAIKKELKGPLSLFCRLLSVLFKRAINIFVFFGPYLVQPAMKFFSEISVLKIVSLRNITYGKRVYPDLYILHITT